MVASHQQSRQAIRHLQRNKKKKHKTQERFEQQTVIKINNYLQTVFPDDELEKIAFKNKLFQRKRELYPTSILAMLMIGSTLYKVEFNKTNK